MPVSPQITITPEDITYKSFTISAVSYTSSTATYTATGHTLSVGNVVQITGLAPDGYNGTYTITGVATNTFTVANTTNTALTDQSGNVYWADATEYSYDGGQYVSFMTNNLDLADPNYNPAITAAATAFANANTALTNAAAAQASANTALANAAIAYTAAQNSLQPSAYAIQNPTTKQLTSINTTGVTVYSGASPTSGARVVMNSVGIAGYDTAGNATFSITASTGAAVFKGTVTGSNIIGTTLNIGGKFYVDGTTGVLQTYDAVLLGTLTSSNATITGTLTVPDIVATGAIYAKSGYFGNSTTGWNFGLDGSLVSYNIGSLGTYTYINPAPVGGYSAIMSGMINADGGFQANGRTWTPAIANGFNAWQSTNVIMTNQGIYAVSLGTTSWRWDTVYLYNSPVVSSDSRLKTAIATSDLGLNFINKLRPVSYKFKTSRLIGETDPVTGEVTQTGEIVGQRNHYGFIAQEVRQALDEIEPNKDFAGWTLEDKDDANSTQSLRYEEFISPIIKAIQELDERLVALEGGN